MKHKFLLKTMLLLSALIAGSGSAWADDTYTKVTSTPSDWSGTYIIVADASNVVFTGQSGTNNYGGYTNVTISNNTVTGNFSDYEVLVEKSGDYYTMKHVSSSKYLGWNSGNNLHFSTTEPSTNSFKWSLSTSSILNANDNSRKLQYNSSSPRFACYTSSQKAAYLYKKESGSTPTCEIPTFSPAAGVYTSAQNVTISSETTDATIYYTTDGTDPTTSSTQYNGAISVSSTTTIKAIAVKEGNNNSSVASATYAILGHAGTEADPYSVADARAAIDANVGLTGVYVSGIVCEGGSSLSSGALNYWISDDGTETDKFEVYKGKGLNNANFIATTDVVAGAEVVVYGDIKKFNTTYEFNSGNYLISYTAPTTPTIATSTESLSGFTYEAGSGPSAAQQLTIGGANLTDDCHANLDANSNFEYSFTDNDNDYFSDGGIATQANQNTVIYVRLKSGLAVGDYNGTITITSEGAQTVTVNLSGSVTAPEAAHVTWDLSIASYDEVTDADIVTWSSAYATMTNSSKSGGTSASNYLGGDSNNRTSSRFYNGNTLTISPAAGYSITSIEFVAMNTNYADALRGSTWTNASVAVSGTTVTVTPTDGAAAVSAAIGGTCGFTSVKVYYEAAASSAPVWSAFPTDVITTLGGNDVELLIGDYVTGNPAPTIELIDATAESADYDFDPSNGYFVFTPSAAGIFDFTFKAENSEGSEEATLSVTVNAPTASIEVSETTIEVAADETTGYVIVPVTYNNFTTVDAHAQLYEDDGVTPLQSNPYTWITVATYGNDFCYKINETNTSSEPRTVYCKVWANDDNGDPVSSELITITQAGYVAPFTPVTYTLASSITSGKHYIITNGTDKAMGLQNTNNRAAVDVTIENGTATVSSADVYEMVVYGPDADGYYTIYDATTPGYLYAVGGTNNNHLKIETTPADHGHWTIEFDTDNKASIVANINGRNTMRYNSSNDIFSCYVSGGQQDIYLYEKDGEATPTESKTLNGSGYATYCSQNALDFTNASDYSAWAITSISGSTITFSQITGAVPAGTGMLLKGTASSDITLTSATGTVAALSSNLLVGTTADFGVENDGDYYGLSGQTFVKVKAGTVSAGKALLPKSAVDGNPVKAFTFVFEEDDATGVETIDNGQLTNDNEIYNLAGQRLQKMQKGINIVNGKKVLF